MTFILFKRAVLLVLVVLFLFAAPVSGKQKLGFIKIGATVSLAGKYVAPSEMLNNAYRLWEKRVNENGGLLGRHVKIIFYDDRSSKSRVSELYEKLIIEDRVDLLLAPYGSPLTLEAAKVAENYGYFLLASAASADSIWDRGFEKVFGVYAPASRYFIGYIDLIARHGFKSLSVIHEKSIFNVAAARGAKKWAGLFGVELVVYESFESADDFPELIARVRASKSDSLLICAYPPDVYRFLEYLQATDFRPGAMAFAIAPALPDFYEKAGPLAEGVFGPSQWEADERLPFPGTRNFIRSFTRFCDMSPSYHAGSAYAACQLLQRAVTSTKSLNHEKISMFIRSLDTVTVIGRFKVDQDGRQVGHNAIIIQWLDGEKEIVYPTKMRTAQPRF